jgi:hypothetical protein
MRPALAALVAAVALVAWSAARLADADTLPPPAAGDPLAVPNVTLARTPPARRSTPDDDLFSADRTPRDARYALPGERVAAEPSAAQTPIVLGTALATDGRSFVSASLGDGPPRILHVGDTLGPFTLRSIDRRLVSFSRASGGRVDVRPGATAPSGPR